MELRDALTQIAEIRQQMARSEVFRGYRIPGNARSLRVARSALERLGIEPREVATGGGSDANALIAQGFECVLLANGTTGNHTPEEAVAADALTKMLGVCEAIATEVATAP